ncbi:hypothetical protein VNI00_005633 [Paramarasmius palmivorus]|uniref:Uncharacterized protein n=1 Tax=Paramarasmius palmivorus TaxID=297713 RepID=A0AAW0DEP5_9AGAR
MPFAVYNALRAISLFLCLFRVISVLAIPTENAHSFYTTPHSLGHSYTFEARDGWTSVNISNRLSYTHLPDSQKHLEARSHTKEHTSKNNQGKKSKTKTKTHNTKGKANLQAAAVNVTGAISKLGEELKGIGQPQGVTITWLGILLERDYFAEQLRRYDGQDLKNPSCWSSDVWTPTVSCSKVYRIEPDIDARRMLLSSAH